MSRVAGKRRVAAVSVGVIDGEPRLDLDYEEDVRAGVDMNVVMSSEGRFVEVQGTGEHGTFDRAELDGLLDLAVGGSASSTRRNAARSASERRRSRRPLLLATRSEGKLRELRPLFAARGIGVIDLDEAGIAESTRRRRSRRMTTFEENALAKARYFHELSGLPTVADDSGLAVDALGGRPGVHSKRWSGRADSPGRRSTTRTTVCCSLH